MGRILTWGKGIVAGLFFLVVALGWKSAKLDNVEANQQIFAETQSEFRARMNGYDRELETVRIESKLNQGLLKDGQTRLIRIEQLLLDRK